jgi:hypothetical protein
MSMYIRSCSKIAALCIVAGLLVAQAAPSLVFVYLGGYIPAYVADSMHQARIFNPESPIYCIMSDDAIAHHQSLGAQIAGDGVCIINTGQLVSTPAHELFKRMCHDRPLTGYWRYTTERFFYVDELMRQYNLRDLFQIECDVMVYIDFADAIDILRQTGARIASPFLNDYTASVSVVYFADTAAAAGFSEFIAQTTRYANAQSVIDSDMYLLAAYKNIGRESVQQLPTMGADVIRRDVIKNGRGEGSARPWEYWNHIHSWQSIFDCDGLATWIERREWVLERALFNPQWYEVVWHLDDQGRRVPYLHHGSYCYRVNSLHVLCKNLQLFRSTPF